MILELIEIKKNGPFIEATFNSGTEGTYTYSKVVLKYKAEDFNTYFHDAHVGKRYKMSAESVYEIDTKQ